MIDRDGGDLGTFTTAAPDWRHGDVVLLSPQRRVKIVDTREADDDSMMGEWVVEPP
jgi:hypothetical protein